MQVSSQAPTSTTQAEGLSSRVFALATTPSLLAKAMSDAGVTGSPDALAKKVSADRLGESSVIRLSVTGTDATEAENLATALADRVATFMNQGDRDHFDSVMAKVDAGIADAQQSHAKLLGELNNTVDVNARTGIRVALQQVNASLSELATERANLMVADTTRDQVALVDGSNPDVQRLPSPLVPDLALAGVFGLVLGLTLAAGLEISRPRIRGSRAVARALKSPVIGARGQQPAALADTMALAARRRGVETVVLLPADERHRQPAMGLLRSIRKQVPLAHEESQGDLQSVPDDVERVGASNRRPTGKAKGQRAETVTLDPFGTVRFAGLTDLEPTQELSAGVVVVTSGPLSRRDLDALEDLLAVVRWPMLGVVDAGRTKRDPR